MIPSMQQVNVFIDLDADGNWMGHTCYAPFGREPPEGTKTYEWYPQGSYVVTADIEDGIQRDGVYIRRSPRVRYLPD
jgi:hypothetical protein